MQNSKTKSAKSAKQTPENVRILFGLFFTTRLTNTPINPYDPTPNTPDDTQ